MALGATFDPEIVQAVGVAVAKEALAKHFHAPRNGSSQTNALSFFAPNINIVRDVRWGRAQETYGEDPTLTSKLGTAYVRGMQYLGGDPATSPLAVRNVAKHFAAYNVESDFAGRTTPAEIARGDGQFRLSYNARVPDADLQQTFLPAFKAVVRDANIRGVMCAYNSVDGTPLCANRALLQDELRESIGHDGIIITDCGAIGFMTTNHMWKHANGSLYTPTQATAAALMAGTDLNCGSEFSDHLPAALAAGLVSLSAVDTAVGRALKGHMELGMFQDSSAQAADFRRTFPMDVVDSASHRALAKKAAIEGAVLLKNENGALPLLNSGRDEAAPNGIRIAVLGPNANRTLTLASNYAGCKDRAGGPLIPSCTFVNPLQGIRAAAAASGGKIDSSVAFAQGVDIDSPDRSGIAEAVAVAEDADVVVLVVGLVTCAEVGPMCQEAEARDRSTPVNADGTDNPLSTADLGRDYGIGLPGGQPALVRAVVDATSGTSTKVVLVLMSGSAVAVTRWAGASSGVSAILQMFYPGVLGGEALADLLVGAAAPGGKLPVMIPTSEAQLPADYLNQSMQAGMGRTHRYFRGSPLFGFGHGLSYATFSLASVEVSHGRLSVLQEDRERGMKNTTVVTVSVSVTNNGEFAAARCSEVVFVFGRPNLASNVTPRMSVPQRQLLGFAKVWLRAGETRRVRIEVPVGGMRLVGPGGGRPVLLEGRWELDVVGGSALRQAVPGGWVIDIER